MAHEGPGGPLALVQYCKGEKKLLKFVERSKIIYDLENVKISILGFIEGPKLLGPFGG